MSKTILVFTTEMLPGYGYRTAGGGIRAWNIGQGLASRGHKVIYSIPKSLAADKPNLPQEVHDSVFEEKEIQAVIDRIKPDVVVCIQWHIANKFKDVTVPVAIDLFGLLMLENMYFDEFDLEHFLTAKVEAMAKADYFVCASEKQVAYFLPWLMMSGVDPKEDCIGSIPVSLSPDLPKRTVWNPDLEFIFSGIFWPWQNPFPALNAVIETMNRQQRGQLKIYGGQHPYWKEYFIKYPNPEQELLKSDRVVYSDLILHEQLMQELLTKSVAVDLMAKNNERILAFPIRTVCYLWNGVPVIIGNYSDVSKLVTEYQAGWALDPNDKSGIKKVVDQIFADPDLVKRYSQNAQKLVREKLTWDKTIEPLHQFCLNPKKLEKKDSMLKRVAERAFRLQYEMGSVYGQKDEIQRELDECRKDRDRIIGEKDKLQTERNELAVSLDNIRNKPLFKAYKSLKSLVTGKKTNR